ncbi:flagellar biosynthetic protein FliR [Microbulbifer sp. TRSA002]|uniref:flagellar biosynthetic protein FliR n=1 Tax=Microbulbifer sp. TRSA002 TaxID=3243382 RepID=UPI004039C082
MLVKAGSDFAIVVLLVAARLAPIFFSFPLQAIINIPLRIRFFLTISFSLVISSALDLSSIGLANDFNLALMLIKEIVIGVAFSAAITAATATFLIAGRLIDFQMGVGAATQFNASTSSQNSLVGTMLALAGTAILFASDTHHILLKGIYQSFIVVPIGTGIDKVGILNSAVSMGKMFLYGAVIAAPVIFGLMMADLVVVIFARTMPQMNPYFVGMPAKILIGIILLIVSVHYMPEPISAIFQGITDSWQKVAV